MRIDNFVFQLSLQFLKMVWYISIRIGNQRQSYLSTTEERQLKGSFDGDQTFSYLV